MTFVLLQKLQGVRVARDGGTQWIQSHDHSLVTLVGNGPCEVTCGDVSCVVTGLADLASIDRVADAARALDRQLTVHRLVVG